MKLSLIITTYNWPESLLLVLESIKQQTLLPYEVIIADDGSDFKTKDLINNFKNNNNLKIIHSWQEDMGFRAARSRNNAINKSSGDYIVLIDGDTILHPNFIKDHFNYAEPGFFIQGSRVLLTEKKTNKTLTQKKINFSYFDSGLINRKNALYSKFLSLLLSSKKNKLNGIKSCNMGFYKKDCINVNGFNNDIEGWGREDSEFIVRIINSGINRKTIRFGIIQYHLWHNENSRKSLSENDKILFDTIKNNSKYCKNGIKKTQ